MNQVIKTYADLEKEKLRLQFALGIQGQLIQSDIATIKEELKPLQTMMVSMGKFISAEKPNPIMNIAFGILGDIVLKKMVFGRSGIVTRLVAPFLLNVSTRLFSHSGDTPILQRIGGVFQQFKRLFSRAS